MTNKQIIAMAAHNLAAEGIIGYTGRTFEGIDGDGNPVIIREPEEIHTYAKWAELGYQVQKGQKAVAKFAIWKYTTKKDKETGEEINSMFLKTAAFFSASQVQRQEQKTA